MRKMLINLNKFFPIVIGAALCTACVPAISTNKSLLKAQPSTDAPKPSATPAPTTNSVSGTSAQTSEFSPTLKLFNQYNQSLSKITGVNAGLTTIATEYSTIKNSLPADSNASSFTPFHQIAYTRMAFAYCNEFIVSDPYFKALNYTTTTADQLTKALVDKFIGEKSAINQEKYDQFYPVILKIISNDAGVDDADQTNIGKLIPNTTLAASALKINLTKLGCTAILSSTDFTTL